MVTLNSNDLTVSDLHARIKTALSSQFPSDLWVVGEVQSFKVARSGHIYFDIVDRPDKSAPPKALISTVTFSSAVPKVHGVFEQYPGVELADGVEIRIRGKLSTYQRSSSFQLIVTELDPAYTLGKLAANKDLLISKLESEGILRSNREKYLAAVPLKVALVTSEGSAAHQDFQNELDLSGFNWKVATFYSLVQGPLAVNSLKESLEKAFVSGADIVVVTRGGGAKTDLMAFDDENLARLVSSAPIPVVCGIGHEVDDTVFDYVCYRSFKTPTAVAAGLVGKVAKFLEKVSTDHNRALSAANLAFERESSYVSLARSNVYKASTNVLASYTVTTPVLRQKLESSARRKLGKEAEMFPAKHKYLSDRVTGLVEKERALVKSFTSTIAALNPENTLRRGYAIIRSSSGSALSKIDDLDLDAEFLAEIADGHIVGTVVSKEKK